MNGQPLPLAGAARELVSCMREVSAACGLASVALVEAREHLAAGRPADAAHGVGAALRRLFDCAELISSARPLADSIVAGDPGEGQGGSASPGPSRSPEALTRSAVVRFTPVDRGPLLLSVNAGASAELAREVAETLLAAVGSRLRDAQAGEVVGGDEAMMIELAVEVAHAMLVAARATN